MDNVRPMRPRKPAPAKKRGKVRRRVITAAVVVAVIILLSFGGRLLGLYVDWLWFGEVGFRSVLWTRVWAKVLLGLVAFAAFFAFVWLNVEVARRLAPSYRADESGELLEPRSPVVRKWVGIAGALVCAIAALFAAAAAAGSWQTFLLYFNKVPWGETDPVFGRDISFYVFSVPAWQGVLDFVTAALIVALVFVGIVHLVMGAIDVRQTGAAAGSGAAGAGTGKAAGGPASAFARAQAAAAPDLPQVSLKLGGRAVAHLSALLAAVFVVTGIGQFFRGWSLLYSKAGAVYGAGFTDIHVRLPLTRVTMVIAFILAAALIANVWRRRQWWPAAIVVWIVAIIVLRGIVPPIYQSLIVNPNQLSKEREYLTHNLKATKKAYGLDAVVQKPLASRTPLTSATLRENQGTVRNIRLWDPSTLVTSYRELQELRRYYTFVDADVDRYTVNGVYRQTMLSAREFDFDGLKPAARTWVNEHITYTHGFGVVMSAVNQVTADGSPDFLVRDIPPRSVKGLEIKQPRIYYGERGTEYSLVNTKEAEFDYPGATGDVYTDGYSGSGGVPISPLLNRLAFAARYGTIKFFTTSAITSDSRLIFRNEIRERMRAAAPFLSLDQDPYMVIADGRLLWIQDAYTLTSRYPYSTPSGKLNYIRNSVKIVIDAYNGSMVFYAWDEKDPLLQAWRAIYPDLFTPRGEMSDELTKHVRYPESLFDIQAEIWATYHVDGPEILYNQGDQWSIPENVELTGSGRMQAYNVIMRLPEEDDEEFLLMLPFVPNGRQNMISWLAARSDVPEYGTALNYIFSKSTTVFGPSQVEATINQDPDISTQRTLWGQQGSRVILGNLLVVPIEDSLLYVQPLYLQSVQTKLPQLKRVIVFYREPAPEGSEGNARQVVLMRPTFGEALAAAFGEEVAADGDTGTGGTGTGAGGTGTGTGGAGGQAGGFSAEARALIARANQEFDAAQQALQAGDFAEYGRRIEAVQQALRKLQSLQ